MRRLRTLLRHQGGASAAEFAIILPLALLFLFGIIDLGRYAWTFNQMEKAAQMGARYAVATNLVPAGLNSYNFSTSCGGTLKAGDRICKDALGTINCTGSGASVQCTCGGGNCNSTMIGTPNTQAFANILARMRYVTPEIESENVTVRYSGSGIGFYGDPAIDDDENPLSDVSPTVTVLIRNAQMRALCLLGGHLPLPTIKVSLTLEDGSGALAY